MGSLQFLAQISIGRRLWVNNAVLVALLSLGLAFLGADVRDVSGALSELAATRIHLVDATALINADANVSARKMLFLVSADRERRVRIYAEIDAAHQRIRAQLRHLRAVAESIEAVRQIQEVERRFQQYCDAYGSNIDVIESGDLAQARNLLASVTEVSLGSFLEATWTLFSTQEEFLNDQAASIHQAVSRSAWSLGILLVFSALLGAITSRAVRKSITVPLRAVEEAARQMRNGDYGARVPVHGRDEVSRLGEALNEMAEAVGIRQAKIEYYINVDPMTGLITREKFLGTLRHFISVHEPLASQYGIVCLDVDRLKEINALIGFEAGDEAIKVAAERLVALFGADAVVSRLSGGTFAVLVKFSCAHEVAEYVESMRGMLERPIRWRAEEFDLSLSCGIAMFHSAGDNPEKILRHCEHALYECKRLKSGSRIYTTTSDASRQRDLTLSSDLQVALHAQQLKLFLQPKLSCSSNQLVGAEALIRWNHPQRGWIPPSEFIPFAERTGRIRALTRWVIAEAVAMLAQEQDVRLYYAINISTQDLQDPSLPGYIDQLLREHGVAPGRLSVELTESGLMDSGAEPIGVLNALKALGVRIALDDFGTGHSALAYLKNLPVDELKIDRSFVQGCDEDALKFGLLSSVVHLGHNLRLTVTAEGAECAGELDALCRAGCDVVQGYFTGRPMPAEEFAAWRMRRDLGSRVHREALTDRVPPIAA